MKTTRFKMDRLEDRITPSKLGAICGSSHKKSSKKSHKSSKKSHKSSKKSHKSSKKSCKKR